MVIRAISYGGGVQSTALLVLAAKREIDFPLAMFSNVGDDSEHPATLEYFHEVARPYAEKNGIELVELRKRPRGKERTLYQELTNPDSRSIGIPVRMGSGAPGRRNCTVQYKINRIASHLKVRGASAEDQAVLALGISIDEFHRMKTTTGIAWEVFEYPLIDLRLSRDDCERIIREAGLPVPPKSSCWFCPFKRLDQWKDMKQHEPDLFEKSVELERILNDR
ncbi:MAG TPA: hypothetical protein VLA89_13670, partial [Gemmatimonadales bacterium]|nr:hypothetical protein [Gemmatimonadales bacterium]